MGTLKSRALVFGFGILLLNLSACSNQTELGDAALESATEWARLSNGPLQVAPPQATPPQAELPQAPPKHCGDVLKLSTPNGPLASTGSPILFTFEGSGGNRVPVQCALIAENAVVQVEFDNIAEGAHRLACFQGTPGLQGYEGTICSVAVIEWSKQ